jgi:hypothetical protein
VANTNQANADGDTLGDACDACPNDSANDVDADTVCGNVDNCPTVANTNQANADGDTLGDACDACPNDPANDVDGDGVCADVDNCPADTNPGQENEDGDARGDVCDPCPSDPDDQCVAGANTGTTLFEGAGVSVKWVLLSPGQLPEDALWMDRRWMGA